ncbi:MAG: 16S rRNA (guanine(966)-N(2))-methyltransferase RsmD [Bacteroidales bacterium]|nr:16S rRNA (guanine(966)-N(2))-methyltransferase RsmD [Bacteroidales bacterium]
MRIISGKNKGRKIVAPEHLPVRPTTDRAKESLFNILMNEIDLTETTALDLFSGTGNISYELISRGCKSVTSVDKDAGCCSFIKQMAEKLGYENLYVMRSDYHGFIENSTSKFDLIFADPPYDMQETVQIPSFIFEFDLLQPEGLFILEHDRQIDFSESRNFYKHRKYGKVNFSFFRA